MRGILRVAYEVVLLSAALDVFVRADTQLKEELAECLRLDLDLANIKNARYRIPFNGSQYDNIVMSNGYTATVRAMRPEDLRALRQEARRHVERKGVFVFDLLPAGRAINPGH